MALSGWKDEVEVEDEFTCQGVLHGTLLELKPVVERVFWVRLKISGEGDGHIWLHLRGRKRETEAAKLFIIGVVNQEAQEEVQYPAVLHCVFCGAGGFFTDCLTRTTSAHVLVGSLGCVLISGLAEPVVKAYSLILDLVERHRNSQSQCSGATTQSMQTCKDFKLLVDKLEGSHTLDLMVLPVLVKEVLLDLVKQSGLNLDTWDGVTIPAGGGLGTGLLEAMDKLELGGVSTDPGTSIANKMPKIIPNSDPEQEKTLGSEGAPKEDFMLGVLKKAAATCGYTEDEVDEIYSNLPELSPHELIRELQKKIVREPGKPTETKDQVKKLMDPQRTSEMKQSENETLNRGREGGPELPFLNLLPSPNMSTVPPAIRGPPQPRYYAGIINPYSPLPNISEPQLQPPEPDISRTKKKPFPTRPGAVITGQQRFLEGLETAFKLQLSNKHGDSGLRQIIIDGSNVAMTHGLGTFFSCRGIALAVQYFWGRGHRRITAFVPQWRQKKDPKIKEQHFMTQLQELGLLSFTPSREVKGQRINSYDDRLMLQLAKQTGGVIVTNDNLRDLVDESVEWREIIKSRLLQYVFAGDLFMVPDDPLGRNGPHIDEFLRAQASLIEGSPSFAGVTSTPVPPYSSQPRAQTNGQQHCERTLRGIGRAQDSGRPRTVDETLRLKHDLEQIFQGWDGIRATLERHPVVTDINQLSHYILDEMSREE